MYISESHKIGCSLQANLSCMSESSEFYFISFDKFVADFLHLFCFLFYEYERFMDICAWCVASALGG